MEKAIPYTRTSGKEQRTGSVSHAKQLGQIQAIARERKLELLEVVSDDGVSGSVPLFRRPGGKAVRQACEDGCRCVMVAHTDRLFRDVADSLQVAGWILENGITVIAGNEVLDYSSPEGEFMLILKVALAQLERRRTGQRILETNRHKRARGERLTGKLPYGFEQYDTGAVRADGKPVYGLQVNETEAEVIRRILKSIKAGMGPRTIARQLNEDLVLSRTGNPWQHTTVAEIARRAMGGKDR